MQGSQAEYPCLPIFAMLSAPAGTGQLALPAEQSEHMLIVQ